MDGHRVFVWSGVTDAAPPTPRGAKGERNMSRREGILCEEPTEEMVPISAVSDRDLSPIRPELRTKDKAQGNRAEYKQEAHTALITTMLQLVHE
jgi:hypothetical protein